MLVMFGFEIETVVFTSRISVNWSWSGGRWLFTKRRLYESRNFSRAAFWKIRKFFIYLLGSDPAPGHERVETLISCWCAQVFRLTQRRGFSVAYLAAWSVVMLNEQEIERWLDKQGVLIGYELHRIAIGEETALQQILKDGIVCCRIVNCLIPNKIEKVSADKSSDAFRENFQHFRKALSELGISPVSFK